MECVLCGFTNPPGVARCVKCSTPLEIKRGGSTGSGSGWSIQTPTAGATSAVTSVATLKPGTVLGERYEILELLGEGGMGAVYKAKDRVVDRFVALKVIRSELSFRPEVLQRFKQELILARQVTHKNVIRIFDLGEADGIKFISMDYIEGRDLKSLIREKRKFPPEDAKNIVVQVCRALNAAHSEGVIHRDLKPQNIVVDSQGRVTVMDFGIARSTEMPGLTQTGMVVGTPEYMAPEQAKGEKVDGRSDLYSLGIIFYELLTGETPHHADTALAILLKRTQERPRPPVELDPSIPPVMNRIVVKCLEIDANVRYQSAQEILRDLEVRTSTRTALTAAIPAGWGDILRAHKLAAAVAAGIAVSLLMVAVIAFRLKNPPKPKAAHAPVSVLVADFTNHTGDPIFDGTLEPMVNFALEGASFINAFNRGNARKLAGQLPHPTDKLDEQSARLVAVSQGVSAVITGELSRRGDNYSVSATALDSVTGNVLAQAEVTAANKDEVLLAIPKLAAPIRTALGDTTPQSVQVEKAGGAFTAANLEAVHQYGVAMEEQLAGKMEEALRSFAKAAELDPNFARAYVGMASVSANVGKLQDAEKYMKLALEHVDRMTERERYRIRGGYYITSGNFQKCVEEYNELLVRYPGDNIAHVNLGYCFSYLRNFDKAVEMTKRAVQMHPKSAAVLANSSLFSAYGGDFQGGEREARRLQQISPAYEKTYLALAFAQMGQGQFSQAVETYQNLEKVSPLGGSMAGAGLADLALYEGRFGQAVRTLEQGAAADLAANRPDSAADKFAAVAYAQLRMQHKRLALAAAEKALANSQVVKIRFLAAQIFADSGEGAKAQKLAGTLASELQTEPQAYAKIIQGELALKRGDAREAVKAITDANNLLDTWIGRFELGRAYLEAGAFAEADSEFDRCIRRRGEALALFLDEVPTYGYFPPVYYYQGRVREGLKSPGFVEPYRTYLSIRGKAGEDPLLPEIRRRIGQ